MSQYYVKTGVPAPKYPGSSPPKGVALLPNTTWVSYEDDAVNTYVSRTSLNMSAVHTDRKVVFIELDS